MTQLKPDGDASASVNRRSKQPKKQQQRAPLSSPIAVGLSCFMRGKEERSMMKDKRNKMKGKRGEKTAKSEKVGGGREPSRNGLASDALIFAFLEN